MKCRCKAGEAKQEITGSTMKTALMKGLPLSGFDAARRKLPYG